jgi:hypothetical protein
VRFPRETTLLPGFGALLVYHRLRFTPLVRVGIGGGVGGRIAATRAVVVPRVPQGPVVRRLGSAAPTDTSVPLVSAPRTYKYKVTTHKTATLTWNSTPIQYYSRDAYVESHLPYFLHLNWVSHPVPIVISNSSFITTSLCNTLLHIRNIITRRWPVNR